MTHTIMRYPEYEKDLALCKNIQKKYGKSFYAGTIFLSKEQRDATFILYAFFRLPDEYVDTFFADQKESALTKLTEWNNAWHICFNGGRFEIAETETMVLRATEYIFHLYAIPFEYSQAFLQAMIQDTHKNRYATYTELEAYMYGSASVVGLMMTYILCSTDKRFSTDSTYRSDLLQKAQALGEAFQMTNFLRDIGEDYQERRRIYMPQEDMVKYGVTEEDIQNKRITSQFINLMKFEFERTKALYVVADEGIRLLPTRASRGIRVARVLYSRILDKIEEAKYNSLTKRASLSTFKKIVLSLVTLIKSFFI